MIEGAMRSTHEADHYADEDLNEIHRYALDKPTSRREQQVLHKVYGKVAINASFEFI